jgi:hypothetical protein
MHHNRNNGRPAGSQPQNPFTGGGMLAGSVAAGAMYTVWRRAAHHQDPWKKYALLTAGSAIIGVAQELFRSEFNHFR